MKPEAQQLAIAEACGVANRWVIMKGGLYYRPNARGYTGSIREAWIVSEEQANDHVYPHDQPVTKHRAPLPDYLNDRNATFWAAQQLGEAVIKAMRFWLFELCGEMKAHHATAAQEAEAILRAIGKWVE